MRFKLIIPVLLLIAVVAMGQDHSLPIRQNPSPQNLTSGLTSLNSTTFDTTTQSTAQTVDYILVDTTGFSRGGYIQPYFSGSPLNFGMLPDSVSGLATDSISITYEFLNLYDAVSNAFYSEKYDEDGSARAVTLWDNYDWTTDRKYNAYITVSAPCWGIRFTFTGTYKGCTSAQSNILYHWLTWQ